MRVALFYHSLVSDWNHGNAHFLRGIASELQGRGHQVQIFEPANAWSREHLIRDHGVTALKAFEEAFPTLRSSIYDPHSTDVNALLEDVDVVIVHEWNDPGLIAAVGQWRRHNGAARAFFHDTHHRAVTAPGELARFELSEYDGILAYGASLKAAYERLGWGRQVWVWHEAADTRVFYPRPQHRRSRDVVWIGNWGDEERTQELREFLLEPVRRAQFSADVHGVRYPESAIQDLSAAGISYRGWVPNFRVPDVFASFRATIHIPRRPYTLQLPGIPTIRPFEALACGIPLVSAPWPDTEGLFRPDIDFLTAKNGTEMQQKLSDVIRDKALGDELTQNGLETVRRRHTCAHRVDELLSILDSTRVSTSAHLRSQEVLA